MGRSHPWVTAQRIAALNSWGRSWAATASGASLSWSTVKRVPAGRPLSTCLMTVTCSSVTASPCGSRRGRVRCRRHRSFGGLPCGAVGEVPALAAGALVHAHEGCAACVPEGGGQRLLLGAVAVLLAAHLPLGAA